MFGSPPRIQELLKIFLYFLLDSLSGLEDFSNLLQVVKLLPLGFLNIFWMSPSMLRIFKNMCIQESWILKHVFRLSLKAPGFFQ